MSNLQLLICLLLALIFSVKAQTETTEEPAAEKKSTIIVLIEWALIVILVCFSGLFSGLNLGLMGLDPIGLKIVMASDNTKHRECAKKIQPLRKRGNWLLCTLLIGNVAVNAALSILLADKTSGTIGFFVSTAVITVFGEIIPQAFCSRYALEVGAKTVWLVWPLMWLMFVIAYPIAYVLDRILGDELGTIYSNKELQKLVEIHAEIEGTGVSDDTAGMLKGALGLKDALVANCMTEMKDVFWLNDESKLSFDVLTEIFKSGHSRIPIFNTSDKFGRIACVGLLYVKDLILLDPDDEMPVTQIMNAFKHKTPPIVWKDDTLQHLLEIFVRESQHLAFVQDVVRNSNIKSNTLALNTRSGTKYLRESRARHLKKHKKQHHSHSKKSIFHSHHSSEDENSSDVENQTKETNNSKHRHLSMHSVKSAESEPRGSDQDEQEQDGLLTGGNGDVEELDNTYEYVGIITLEDVIEHVLQTELIDEHDNFVDNKHMLRTNRLNRIDWNMLHIFDHRQRVLTSLPPQELQAVYHFLSQTVRPFTPKNRLVSEAAIKNLLASSSVLRVVVAQDEQFANSKFGRRIQGTITDPTNPNVTQRDPYKDIEDNGLLLYQRDKKTKYFTLLLDGKCEIFAGRQGFRCELTRWSYLCPDSLDHTVECYRYNKPLLDYVPDFTAKIVENSRILRIKLEDFQACLQGKFDFDTNPATPITHVNVSTGFATRNSMDNLHEYKHDKDSNESKTEHESNEHDSDHGGNPPAFKQIFALKTSKQKHEYNALNTKDSDSSGSSSDEASAANGKQTQHQHKHKPKPQHKHDSNFRPLNITNQQHSDPRINGINTHDATIFDRDPIVHSFSEPHIVNKLPTPRTISDNSNHNLHGQAFQDGFPARTSSFARLNLKNDLSHTANAGANPLAGANPYGDEFYHQQQLQQLQQLQLQQQQREASHPVAVQYTAFPPRNSSSGQLSNNIPVAQAAMHTIIEVDDQKQDLKVRHASAFPYSQAAIQQHQQNDPHPAAVVSHVAYPAYTDHHVAHSSPPPQAPHSSPPQQAVPAEKAVVVRANDADDTKQDGALNAAPNTNAETVANDVEKVKFTKIPNVDAGAAPLYEDKTITVEPPVLSSNADQEHAQTQSQGGARRPSMSGSHVYKKKKRGKSSELTETTQENDTDELHLYSTPQPSNVSDIISPTQQ